MEVDLSERWLPTDRDVYIVHNFTDVRAKYDFLTGGDNIKNLTLLSKNVSDHQFGANVVYNDTSVRKLEYLINGVNTTRTSLVMVGYRCNGPCLSAIQTVAIETRVRYWSNPTDWDNGTVPGEGDDPYINPGYNFIFDLEESPIYNYVQINGRVTFL